MGMGSAHPTIHNINEFMRKHQSINENKFAPIQAGDCVTKISKMKKFNID